MNITTPTAILIALAVLSVLFLIDRFAPNSAVAKVENTFLADVKASEPTLRGVVSTLELDASGLLAKAELWLTDDSASNAKRAKAAAMMAEANAETATRQAALRAHVTALQAKLAPAAPTLPPGA